MYEDSLFFKVFMGSTLLFYAGVMIWLGWMMFKENYLDKRLIKKD